MIQLLCNAGCREGLEGEWVVCAEVVVVNFDVCDEVFFFDRYTIFCDSADVVYAAF